MPDPATREEYDALFAANTRIEGLGIENVHMVVPCPFCAAPDFADWYVAELALNDYAPMRDDRTCSECGRSGKMRIVRGLDGSTTSEFVQTGGDDPPSYSIPIRRV
jgi:hypothetical protein